MAGRDVLELFAGIGGLAAVVGGQRIRAAVDISQAARVVYQSNFTHTYWNREIDSLTDRQFADWSADLWWFSPPCQPYSRRGYRRDARDRRAFALERVLRALNVCRPPMIGMENVSGFAGSQPHGQLIAFLDQAGYHWQSIDLCPSHLGWPNRRPRYFLIAARHGCQPWRPRPRYQLAWRELMEAVEPSAQSAHLWIESAVAEKYLAGLDRVEYTTDRPTACFAGSYGKTWLQAGSYLETPWGWRRFTPREVARLLGFCDRFHLPRLAEEPRRADRILWKLWATVYRSPVSPMSSVIWMDRW